MVTHDPGAAAYADRVVFLVDGTHRPGAGRPDQGARPGHHGAAGRLTMLKVSLRNLLVNKLRLLLTIAAVTVGVTFVSGTFVLSDTMVKAFDELYTGLTSGTDVVVKSEAAYDADIATTGGQVRPLDDDIVATVREVPGVEVAEGSVFGFALVLDKDGDPIQPGGAPTIGTSLTADRRLAGAATFREGRTPSGAQRDGTRRAHREEGRLRARRLRRRRAPGRQADLHAGRDHRLRGDRQPAGRHPRRVRPAHGPAGARQGGCRRRGRRHGRGRRERPGAARPHRRRCSPTAWRR